MRLPRVLVTLLVAALLGSLTAGAGYKMLRRYQNRIKAVPGAGEESLRPTIGPGPILPDIIGRTDVDAVRVTPLARDRRIIWSLQWAKDGRLFFAERAGRLSVLAPRATAPMTYADLKTALGGESGLMGIALPPAFPAEPFVYVMYTARKPGGGVNRVSRLRDTVDGGRDEQVLLDDIPAARNHDGGALAFGPDGMLYIGTGDAAVPALAQDLTQLSGKILRVTPEGSIPPDNPHPGSPVWAYGFRNVSALAFHPRTHQLWAATHGPSGVAPDEPKHMDSVYVVRKGGNHGWPLHLGASSDPSIVSPVIFFADAAVPPGGMAFYEGPGELHHNLFLTSLRAQALFRFVIKEDGSVAGVERWWKDRYGRLRAITAGPDGSLLIGTSNRDLRASGDFPGSDFILRVDPVAAH
jgi:quinoprotein glucose dehydrogenase